LTLRVLQPFRTLVRGDPRIPYFHGPIVSLISGAAKPLSCQKRSCVKTLVFGRAWAPEPATGRLDALGIQAPGTLRPGGTVRAPALHQRFDLGAESCPLPDRLSLASVSRFSLLLE
jgi:hypothetical protein